MPRRRNGAPSRTHQQPPFRQPPRHHLRREEEPRPILENRWVLHTLKVYARRITKIFKRGMITEGYCWKSLPDHQKDIYWERWKVTILLMGPSIDEAIVRAAYDSKACVRYGALMHEIRALGVRPNFITNEAWNRYREYWANVDFKARSEKASKNRKNEKGGPGTSPSKHIGGTRSFRTYEDVLALDRDENDEVTPNDVFLHVHIKDHDGVTFIDNRLARFHVSGAREEHTRLHRTSRLMTSNFTTMRQESAQKGVFVGSGHLPRGRGDMKISVPGRPKSRWCGVQSLMQLFKGLHSLRLSCRASWECAWTSEQAPFRHHHYHHRHHLRSIIGRLGWIRLVHHSSNMTMMRRTSMIGWMRSIVVPKVSTPKESLKGVQGIGEGHFQVLLFRRTVL
ncbi:hypothetical protein Scep_009563 [Stephania cephalantha]|uniref:Uncharacterized protein n=1 Tax=Stephania cephalantha TaxID=152367 RepID=A0AAP0PD99_9MAGN